MTRNRGRAYFALQAAAGFLWWIAVFTLPAVRYATLGSLDPVLIAIFDIPLFVIGSALAAYGLKVAAVVSAGWTVLVAVVLAVYASVTTEAGPGALVMAAAAGGSLVALSLMHLGRVPTRWMLRGPFAFRPAAQRVTARPHIAATMVQLLIFWGFFLVAVPHFLMLLEQRWAVALHFPGLAGPAGVSLLVLASTLGISSALVMSRVGQGTPLPSAMPNRLVIAGPYRWIRNPMAVAGIVQGAAMGLILGSWLVIAYAVLGSLLWNYAVRPLEESDLEMRFGEEFRQYRRNVCCWIPRLSVLERVHR
ncbi:isoprenylcysteine carboxylmethyltransferase family protein [Paenarthrobacter sp. NPDC089322]|uniref:methyltransferase family protein n=1 Tax=Paenarthrobacter sp. NPDC089322 TaxID=3155065 RepID=UPI00341FBDEE